MRIAHIIDSLGPGGAQKLLVQFAEVAQHRGINFSIISLSSETKRSPFPSQLEEIGAHVVTFPIEKLYNLKGIVSLFQFIRKQKFDVLQTHLEHSNILGALMGCLNRVPVVATLHSTHTRPEGRFYRWRRLSELLALRFGTMRIVVVGNSVANSYQKKLINRELDIIPNAVKLEPPLTLQERKALRVALAKDAERPLLITVGRLIVDKGFHDLLLAFAKVRKFYPKAFLVIVGDGELKQELQAYASSLDLDDHVRFTGLRDDVSKVLLAGDIYVNSSHREGMSVAMLEAMAAGLPILATNVGDAEYLLKDGRGIIVSSGDPDALATGICDLFKSSDLRSSLGNAARELVEKKYTLDVWMNSLLDVYDKVMPQENIA